MKGDPLDALDDDGDDAPAKRRPWGPEEDEHLRGLVDVYGIKSWAQIATNLDNRNGKQCRERWRNHLRPQLNKGDWSAQEDIDIWDRVQEMGTKWAQVRQPDICAHSGIILSAAFAPPARKGFCMQGSA